MKRVIVIFFSLVLSVVTMVPLSYMHHHHGDRICFGLECCHDHQGSCEDEGHDGCDDCSLMNEVYNHNSEDNCFDSLLHAAVSFLISEYLSIEASPQDEVKKCFSQDLFDFYIEESLATQGLRAPPVA